ncbi:M23 family metallopeptidase [Desulfovibrio psychrotolerans]|uniref:M23ase beta-sheet core domain-containing protein n=1 Tax=Desulfovibrio psychrotolerans TaxID=415242 RepID=A0A7J0BS74_9BACT|nr:M23 family metallopeptidase [Desulfovibrio psychrotolerans]GFM35874.1 hypothetical protein DSM19430T_05580 [Desulfovibrio psychrotolerans]
MIGLALCLFSLSPVWAGAQSPERVSLAVPQEVFPGQPFVAEVVVAGWATKGQPLLPYPADGTSSGDDGAATGEHGQPPEVSVLWNGKTVPVQMDAHEGAWRGAVLLGVPHGSEQEPRTLRAVVRTAAGRETVERELSLLSRQYPEQHLNVDRKYVEVAQDDLDRHAAERARVVAALSRMEVLRQWELPMLRPVPGQVSSAYGLTRYFNGKPRKPHMGVDLRGAEGTAIRACADGEVVLAEDHFFAGKSVYIDHGQGVVSMYFHLSAIGVAPGDRVRRGEVVGMVGSTGRVTGPHLHFGLSVQGELVDPLPLLAAE